MDDLRRELLNLPDELLLAIIERVLDTADLCSLAATCDRLNGLVEPFIYRDIMISRGSQAATLASAIGRRPSRALQIKQLLSSTRFEVAEGIDRLPRSLALMKNLKHLSLETPDCNQKTPTDRLSWIRLQERYERIFEQSSILVPRESNLLHNLRKCMLLLIRLVLFLSHSTKVKTQDHLQILGVLHFVDEIGEICSLAKYSALFLHPTLRSLRISCASTDNPDEFLPTLQADPNLLGSTPLEHLHLEECDFNSKTLAVILKFPKALKSLIISEGTRYHPANGYHARKHGDMFPGDLVEALALQKTSLESLSLELGFPPLMGSLCIQHRRLYLNLSEFEALKHLEMHRPTFELLAPSEWGLDSSIERMPPCLESLSLRGLKLRDHPSSLAIRPSILGNFKGVPYLTVRGLRNAKQSLSSLRKISYTYHYIMVYHFNGALVRTLPAGVEHREPVSEFVLDRDAVKRVQEIAEELQKECNLQLKLGIFLA